MQTYSLADFPKKTKIQEPKQNKSIDQDKLTKKRLAMKAERELINSIRLKLKIGIIDKLGGKCSECGYNRHKSILSFHHLDPTLKEGQISNMLTRAAYFLNRKMPDKCQSLIEEVKKCQVLCPTCHAEKHL
jgi:hypothetical protein